MLSRPRGHRTLIRSLCLNLVCSSVLAACSVDRADPTSHPSRPGQIFYVRPTGDDLNPGTSLASAWNTIDRVNRQVFVPGDDLRFEAGFEYTGNLRFDALDAGTPAAPIRIASFGGGRATIEAGTGTALELSNASGFVVEQLTLHGDWDPLTQSGNGGAGLVAVNRLGGGKRLPYLRFRGLDVSGFKTAGIALRAEPSDESKNGGYEDVEITDCSVHDNADSGVISEGPFSAAAGYSHRTLAVKRLRVFGNRGLKHKGSHTGSGIVLSDVDGALIEDSVAYDNGEFNDHPGGGGFGIWAWDSTDVVIRSNESYANKTESSDGGGFDLDGGVTHSVMEYNYSHDNYGAGYGAFQFAAARPYASNAIRYNISQNDGNAVLLWDGNGDMGSLDVYQNVGYSEHVAVASYSAVQDVRLLNNIFFGTGEALFDIYDDSGLSLQGNDYWTGAAPFELRWNTGTSAPLEFDSFETFRAATHHELRGSTATGKNVDPQLEAAGEAPTLNDAALLSTLTEYWLRPDSPLVDQGVDLGDFDIDAGGRDFFGRPAPRGSGFDIGIAEMR
jgi:hypothetical protein